MSIADYLYSVLIPAANSFRSQLPQRNKPFSAIKNAKSCRVKFLDKKTEKKWVDFCRENQLKNDSKLEY